MKRIIELLTPGGIDLFIDPSRETLTRLLAKVREDHATEMENLPLGITEDQLIFQYAVWRGRLDIIDFTSYYCTKATSKNLICRVNKDKVLSQQEFISAIEEAVFFLSKQWPNGNRVQDIRNQTTLMLLNQIRARGLNYGR